tara:strand:- start:142 stop:480 length:339 start_codon:yes stop_codon:yes gene_type:complete
MAHNGIREFSNEELSGVALGQNGFKIISNTEVECGVTAGYTNITYFVAIKAAHDDAVVEARSVILDSDDLTTNSGVYDGSSPVNLINGDIIYGAFDKIEVASGDYVIAYIGK